MIIKPKGEIELIIDYKDDSKEIIKFPNTVLDGGRAALASSLANSIGDSYDFFISKMVFGDGGTTSGVPKYVDSSRNGLFGTTRVSKPVISIIDPDVNTQVVFTSVIAFDEGNTYVLSEMALQMYNGDLYSMVTFPDLTKTSSMQLTYNWRLSFV